MTPKIKLRDGDRVAIIGAGPAGSLFGYTLLRLAKRQNLHLHVDLYDPRDFSRYGPSGCNKCAGVISGSLYQRLTRIGIDLHQANNPIQRVLRGYLWSTERGGIRVEAPPGWEPIRTVFRCAGPIHSDIESTPKKISYDNYLLKYALELGAHRHPAQVNHIEFPVQPSEPVRLELREGRQNRQIEAELVVGAFGLNSDLFQEVKKLGARYRAPRSVRAAQVELSRREGVPKHLSDDYIYFQNVRASERIKDYQIVLIPKGQYATLTLLGSKNLSPEDLKEIKQTPELADILGDRWIWPETPCMCQPRLEISCAKHFYTDRFVCVGDTACCRYYKNGLESALRSAILAAETVVYHGVNRGSFRRRYYPKVRREIIYDNIYGRLLLSMNQSISLHPSIMGLFLEMRASMVRSHKIRQHDAIIWDMLTGNRPYRQIFYRMIHPDFFWAMNAHFIRALWRRLHRKINSVRKFFCRKKIPNATSFINQDFEAEHVQMTAGKQRVTPVWDHTRRNRFQVLSSGTRISIIGGGPGGASCAITLKRLAREQHLELEVTLHESKDFILAAATYHPSIMPSYDTRLNQCIGILSPPIYEIMTRQLGIEFPDNLVQKHILGYVLHSPNRTIRLEELFGSSYASRRIAFDAYMMRQALQHGCHLNLAEVVDFERSNSSFKVITSRNTVEADVIVGAFGVNAQTADIFERRFEYRRPEYMQTIITKRHPSREFLRNFGLWIHAFLPSLPTVEFGAITPKHNHLTVNIAGRHVEEQTMFDFLALPQVSELLPDQYNEIGHEVYFKGGFPTSPAKHFFADRMVIVGDASGMIRPFKGKGVNTALLSGIAAARVMVHRGVGANEFRRFYLPVFHQITEDLWYARTARRLTNLLANSGGMDTVLALAQQSPTLRRALTEAVSGACSYKTILHRLTQDRILWRGGASLLRLLLKEVHY